MENNIIWLLLDSSKGGGIESHVMQLAEGLQQHGEQVEVVFLSNYGKHPMHDALLKQGINSRTLDGSFSMLTRTLKNTRPRVVHTHGYKAGILGRLAAWMNSIACISTFHAGEIATGKLALYDWLDRISAGLADHRFAVSPQIASRLPAKTSLFKNFVNNHNLTTSQGNQIAFVGRVSAEKGPDHFAALATTFANTRLHLYGDGPELASLQAHCPSNLILHGQQDDMSKVWPKIGLLVMPSRYEGLPMAALEAMARGIPVVAFNVGAFDTLIEHQCNGWLVEPGNLSELAKYIHQWQQASPQHKHFVQLACQQTIASQYCSDVAIPDLIENYHMVATAN
ncbi:glycosyltransferase family 4 protein [Psychromonas sp. psych-6C06]|uniref:glycosyltransferase family 4 protein n=1 Tax=Psychromonas sp. psych-6C06 TaxID=2058089 RepID=UPI001930FC4B|nr:glycosyltransferase family 4 protein [Psychromonas sp. psych-6C06]